MLFPVLHNVMTIVHNNDKCKYTHMIRNDMIFIYCNWVSTRWQWSVDLYKNRKETAQKEKQYIIYKNTEYTKYKKKYKTKNETKNIKKHKSSN